MPRRGHGWILLVLLSACWVPACRYDTVEFPGDPVATTGTPTPTPSPTPTLSDFVGDGHDGSLTLPAGLTTINECAPIDLGTGSSVYMPLVSAFPAGRLFVILQMQDAFATSGDATTVTAPGTAGLWELGRVSSIDLPSSALTLTAPLAHQYLTNTTRVAQICTVPEHTTVMIPSGAAIVATDWDGSAGGVVAFAANQTLTIATNAGIAARGAGFRGGVPSAVGTDNGVTALDTNATEGGGKGEGLDSRGWTRFGRGNYANGAGGGNASHAGGGGGGNGGVGGLGGKQLEIEGDLAATQGLGGASVDLEPSARLSPGGGGGGGQNDDAVAAGGNGGGIVLLFVADLGGKGVILADGTPGGDANEDGAGGGGAGGTIVIHALSSSFTGDLIASGAKGGDQFYPDLDLMNGGFGHGAPGGGGGGGRISAPVVVGSGATTDVSGGSSGFVIEDGDPWGAANGADGVVEP